MKKYQRNEAREPSSEAKTGEKTPRALTQFRRHSGNDRNIITMAPTKTPKPSASKPLEPLDVLTLYFKNLEEIKRWYRAKADAGPTELGFNVTAEHHLSAVTAALECAIKGEQWIAPENRRKKA